MCIALQVLMTEARRVLEWLGHETSAYHADADVEVDQLLFRLDVTVADYRVFLSRLYGFLAPLERALSDAPGLDQVIAVEERVKSPHIVRDLLALGLTFADIDALPECSAIEWFFGPISALGWMYVAERAMLATAVIRSHLATRMPLEIAKASRYLSCYDGKLGTRWRELGEAMGRVAMTPSLGARIVASANDAFRTLHHWRTQELQAPSAIRFAG
jgi:heme oxygenase